MAVSALLFDFKRYDKDGAGATLLERWTYTNAERAIDSVPGFAGITWAPLAIKVSGVQHSQEDASVTAEVSVPRDNPIALRYVPGQPGGKLWCSIYRFDGSAVSVIWIGKVRGCEFSGLEAKLRVDSLKARAQRKGLRVEYRATCWKVVYSTDAPGTTGTGCGLSKVGRTHAGSVVSVSADGRTVTTDLAVADNQLKAGLFEAAGQSRTVLANTGGVLTLMSAIQGLTAGAACVAYDGCDHSPTACKAFGNFARFGGHPTVPFENPFEKLLTQ